MREEGRENRGRRAETQKKKKKNLLREEESPRFSHQTGLPDESVTVTFTQICKAFGQRGPTAAAACSRDLRLVITLKMTLNEISSPLDTS